MAAIFVPGHFEQLHRILTDAIANPAHVSQSNEWYIAIDRSRAELVDIARAKGPNEAEKREIQSGKVVIEGVTHSLNADFAQQSIALSQHLQISERYAASLLQAGMQARAKWGRGAVEIACILFHRERLDAIACLKELIDGAATLQQDEDVQARKLGAKMQQLVDAILSSSPQGTTLVQRILNEINETKSRMERVHQSLRGTSNQQQQPSLGDDVQLQMLRMLRKERQDLAHVLFLLSFSKALGSNGILAISAWLANVKETEQNDAIIIYLLIVLLNALEISPEDDDANEFVSSSSNNLGDDRDFIKKMHAELTSKSWGFNELKSVALLQWTLFLAEATKRSPSLGNDLRVHQDTLQKLFMEAVNGNALYSIALRILAFRQRQIDALEGEETDTTEVNATRAGGDAEEEEIDVDFQEHILEQIQALILSLTSVMLPFLRKMQRGEEDAAFAASRSGNAEPPARRYDIEALFDSVSLLCRARPDTGLTFWLGPEGKGTRFLNWAIEVREPGHQRALFDMLASISAGKESAWHAHTLLSSGDSSGTTGAGSLQQTRFVSWSKLFDWVQQFIDSYRSPAAAAHPVTSSTTAVMTSNEAIILRGFFRLLRNVVFYSIAAREALYQNSAYQIIPRLFAMYTCPIDVDVKAGILDSLAAFAHSSGTNAANITAQLWSLLEENLNVTHMHGRSSNKPTLSAALHDLQAIEVSARHYPVTTSLVNLLKSLIHTPERLDQKSVKALVGTSSPLFHGLALNLGQGQRSPGLEPYVDFVVETVFLQAGSREYSDQSERWRVTASCLDFVERCLMSYDLDILINDPSTETITNLILHPGFGVMRRVLTNTKLLHEILSIINPNAGVLGAPSGFEIVNTNQANTLFYASCVRHCLRIIQRVLQTQDIFLHGLLSSISDAGGQLASVDVAARVGLLSSYTPLDALLLQFHQSVVQMALYINCTRDDIALLAIRILSGLAASNAFSKVDKFGGMGYKREMNRLVGLLETSDEADRIRAGCVDRLEGAEDEPASDLGEQVRATLALMQVTETEDEGDEMQKLLPATLDGGEAIRLAILDLLIANTTFGGDAPNIAHLLLGFDLRAVRPEEQVIPDADAFDTPPSALHAILALLRVPTDSTLSIAQRSPAFTEKCLQLITNLCRHPFTSTATMRYLRTKEDFFVSQLESLSLVPVKRTSSEYGATGQLIQPDGGHITTTVDALVSSLQIRGHILSLIALELHTLCGAQMWASANRLVGVLLGRDSVVDAEDDDRSVEVDGERFEQSGIRLLEILSSFEFEWRDDREEQAREPIILQNLDLSQALSQRQNREFEVRATINLLAAAQRELERRGDLSDAQKRLEFVGDSTLILEHVASRNAARVIAIARRSAMQSWRNLLDMTFTRAFGQLDIANRASIILDCLSVLLPRLYGATSESDPALSDLAAGAVLGLLTKLRQHQAKVVAEEQFELVELPVDRLVAVLQALVGAIIEPGTTLEGRGNLYSALINFLQLVKGTPAGNAEAEEGDDASIIDGTSEFDESASFAGFTSSQIGGGFSRKKRASAIETRTKSLLASQAERLIPVIARDALDASDVWRTVAFTLFDRLAALQDGSSSRQNVVLDVLGKKGFLKSFVANIREMDIDLQEVLKIDPSSLNALYVYEAQMAFFNRLAQSKRGAERLVDARIFEILTQVDFLQARPHSNPNYDNFEDGFNDDTFLPAVISRYETLLVPAIQLAVSILFNSSIRANSSGNILATFNGGRTSTANSHTVPRHALSFLQAHRSTLLISLKNLTQDVISLSALSEAQLVISMLVFILPILDDDALSPSKPLAQFHQAILAASATFLYEPHWRSRVVPFTELERQEASEVIVGGAITAYDGESAQFYDAGDSFTTQFDVRARSTVQSLLGALLAYLERASEYAGVDEYGAKRVRPCLTSSLYTHSARGTSMTDDLADLSATTTGPGRYGVTGAGRNPHVASLGTALAGLDENIHRCNEAFSNLEKMQGMLDNSEGVRLEEWDEVLGGCSTTTEDLPVDISDLAPAQRRVIAIRLLKSQKAKQRADVRFYLNCVEMMLVLLYRHFAYYIDLGRNNNSVVSNDKIFLRRSMTPSLQQNQSASETAALIKDGSRITGKVLESLEGLLGFIAEENGVHNAEERKAYIEMTARRLQGVLLENTEDV
ncbi:hypothetical protein L7F22_044221 [Adiantum nelumboides]|nr:hypothetical protein [Adiantum nelumboides]